jgi:hypothetical protein
MANDNTLESLWNSMVGDRAAALKRARDIAAITLPVVCPPEGTLPDEVTTSSGYSSFCSAGVSGLATKLRLALFSPNRPFFKLQPTLQGEQDHIAKYGEDSLPELDEALAEQERAAMAQWDQRGETSVITAVLEALCITGNVLVYEDDINGNIQYRAVQLQDFCIRRTVSGLITTVIIKDSIEYGQLDEKTKLKVATGSKQKKLQPTYTLDMYTAWEMTSVTKEGPRYIERQEIAGVEVYKSKRSESQDDVRWFYVGGKRAPKATYALPLIYPHMDDMLSQHEIAKAVIQGGIEAADYVWGVDPTSGDIAIERFAKASRGDVIPLRQGHVQIINSGTINTIVQLMQVQASIEQRLAKAFLQTVDFLQAQTQTTATEVRTIVTELERAYSGVYSELAQNLQYPLAKRLMKQAGEKVDYSIDLRIITGIESLSRESSLEAINRWTMTMANILQLNAATQGALDVQELNRVVTAACGSPTQSVFIQPKQGRQDGFPSTPEQSIPAIPAA